MPTDDPVPRTKPRRPTADTESGRVHATGSTTPTAASPTGEVAANGAGPPAVRPRPLPDDDADARIDEFLANGPEPMAEPPRLFDRGTKSDRRRRGKGPKAPAGQPTGAQQALVGPVGAETVTASEAALIAPRGRRARRASRRLRARRVHRLVRHVEPWSVLKLALVFYFCLWVIMLVAGAILWRVAVSSGVIDNIEAFIESLLVLDNFRFNGDELFRAYAVGGLLMVLIATGFTVLATVLFNLISDLIGGVRVTVIQEETARPGPERPFERGPGPERPFERGPGPEREVP
ncbi:MAG TPA: DUF3566 domain-containing protein [Acidimicrobiales bacterium]|nr:DUF3566 domain-containing protein [Acidimicrobiales bacterium]